MDRNELIVKGWQTFKGQNLKVDGLTTLLIIDEETIVTVFNSYIQGKDILYLIEEIDPVTGEIRQNNVVVAKVTAIKYEGVPGNSKTN